MNNKRLTMKLKRSMIRNFVAKNSIHKTGAGVHTNKKAYTRKEKHNAKLD